MTGLQALGQIYADPYRHIMWKDLIRAKMKGGKDFRTASIEATKMMMRTPVQLLEQLTIDEIEEVYISAQSLYKKYQWFKDGANQFTLILQRAG